MATRLSHFFLPFVLLVMGCNRDADVEPIASHKQILQEQIFNGHTHWMVLSMESDTEREWNGHPTTRWSEQFPACIKDNVYQFGALGNHIASIHIDEADLSCNPEESPYISQALVLDFSNDYSQASVFVKGTAMNKLFALPFDERVKNLDFIQSWQIERIDPEQLVVKAHIPADQAAGMADKAIEVTIVFEPIN